MASIPSPGGPYRGQAIGSRDRNADPLHSVSSKSVPIAKPITLTDEQVETISRAVADPRRFAILRQIARDQALLCVALEEHQTLSPATISHHLTVLQQAGLIEVAREGRNARMTFQRDIWQAYLKTLAFL